MRVCVDGWCCSVCVGVGVWVCVGVCGCVCVCVSCSGGYDQSDQMYNLVKGMQSRGVPIDGVGLQFHWSLDGHESLSSVAQNMARFHDLGLEVHITGE